MQHSKDLSVTAVKDISTVSTTNKIKIAIVFLARTGRFWSCFFSLRLAANSAMGVLTDCHFISRLILKYSKNLHLNRAIKAKEKIPRAFSKFWIKQHTNGFHVWEWRCPLLGNPQPEKALLFRVPAESGRCSLQIFDARIFANSWWFRFALCQRGGRNTLFASFYGCRDRRYRKDAVSVLISLWNTVHWCPVQN